MALPYLKVDPEKAIEVLDNCIVSGYQTKDRISSDYFQNKEAATEEKHQEWQTLANEWANKCLDHLGEVFVSQKELYNFRDAPASGLMISGTSIKWNGINNIIAARIKKLNEYDRYIRDEFNVKMEVVGRDKIVQYGSGNEVEIDNSE